MGLRGLGLEKQASVGSTTAWSHASLVISTTVSVSNCCVISHHTAQWLKTTTLYLLMVLKFEQGLAGQLICSPHGVVL